MAMSVHSRNLRGLLAAFAALAFAFAAAPDEAAAGTYGDRLVAEGDGFFRAGNFFRASESYRCAVLEEPADGMKKLQFGHSLFALGNYAYAAYSFRRGVRYLGYPDDLRIELTTIFPNRTSYERSVRDVRRFSSYYPADPHALTVIAYITYFGGDRIESETTCRKLLALDSRDAFAAYLMRRLELEAGLVPASPFEMPVQPGPLATVGGRGAIRPVATNAGGTGGGTPSVTPAVDLRRPPTSAEKPLPPVETPAGERSGTASTLSKEEPRPALAK